MFPPSITELPNELTNDIDVAGAEGLTRLLRQTDAQIFNGWREFPGLYDVEILSTLERLTGVVADALKTPEDTAIVMSGAGTSGRLAYFVAREFNYEMAMTAQPECFYYLMAGGDKALIRAQEGAEDDPEAAVRDLRCFERPGRRIIYIGITCGCSAPYIAAQLDYAMTRPQYVTVLLGFNPLERARRTPIERWDKTFYQVMSALASYDDDRHFIVNPVIGPEPITGSTRMKGGTATKLLLEAVFTAAIEEVNDEDEPFSSEVGGGNEELTAQMTEFQTSLSHKRNYRLLEFFAKAELIFRDTYLASTDLSPLILAAGHTLRRGGHIYYLGSGTFGILGLVDASECPPTYGADFSDVRGFVGGGWDALRNTEGDLSQEGPLYRISLDDFQDSIMRTLSENDVVIFLNNCSEGLAMPLGIAQFAREKGAKLACVSISIEDFDEVADEALVDTMNSRFDDGFEMDDDDEDEDDSSDVASDENFDEDDDWGEDNDDEEDWRNEEGDDWDENEGDKDIDDVGGFLLDDPVIQMCDYRVNIIVGTVAEKLESLDCFAELACKWTLNAITTGAHVLKGKVFQNRMIDLRISNNKLYYRSIGIISQLMGVDEETARECLLRAIYQTDQLSEAQRGAPISAHIETGATVLQIVPVALLLATGQFNMAAARDALGADPIVRNIILKYAVK